MREYFCAYHSMLGGTRKLSDAECGRLFRALLAYSAGTDVGLINLQGREEVLFDVYSQQIDRDVAAYESKCSQNKANASGGKRTPANASDRKRTPANASDGTQDKDKEKDEDKEEYKEEYKDEGDSLRDPYSYVLPDSLKKKINNNYKHSSRARKAVAQAIVDCIAENNLPPGQLPKLYDSVLCALIEGLSPGQIYAAADMCQRPGDFSSVLLMLNGGKWDTDESQIYD